ncbi:NAD(P)-binding domain-containing protein [Pseudobacteriovorax antillogorgiicola]|uniref:Thioredoxin reductase n=1 Tax=Pseudobacteriovorax antillogorgiicola TaxID=1513793 RepID=A0A1Y6C4W2_9BACT|nr:NAD(P)-binding domain-containing protein [Pseudobacteriovorax antillogorgiicola]TCS51266.1 thioredoxin reductase [Pseudobacteriovorax antillogorgiicola]SMF36402.1 Thioredoxin reductase [Pseudobacteriovorax antillogorgiicola]
MLKLYYILTEYLWVFGVGFFVYLALRGVKSREKHEKVAKKKWKDAVEKKMDEPMTLHPEIDPNLCSGCGACVTACPEGEILKLIHHKAKLIEPTKCVGHGACEVACPLDAIKLVFGTKTRGMQLPRISPYYETNVGGLYIAGELGGMGLIRNAVKQGKLAAEHACSKVSPGKAEYDVLVVGAGPAGLAASLTCAEKKKKYICLEQNKFGGTIYNFPKQKVVMSHPLEFPLAGMVKFPRNKVSKEEILAVWGGLRKKYNLQIKENAKFINLKKKNGIFHVETNNGIITASKVIMAMGVRGSPRKLGLKGEESTKVTYNLLDPDQYQKCDIAVVGGGNAAVEAAQYLAKSRLQNRVYLLVRGPQLDRCNEDNQNIIFDMAKKKKVVMCFDTVVSEIYEDYLIVDRQGQRLRLQNDFLFIFAGAELPFKFLESLGVVIDTKYGEAVKTG